MKIIDTTAAAALVAALGLATASGAFAQDRGPRDGAGFDPRHEMMAMQAQDGDGPHQMGGRGGLLQLGCSEHGAERLEHVFVSLSYNLDLTAEQTPLFDALKTAALTAQTGLADVCDAAYPATGQAKAPSIVERVETGIKLDEARIVALSDVLPELEAFYDSLTDEQKARLDGGPGAMRGHFGKRQGGPMVEQFRHHLPMTDQNG